MTLLNQHIMKSDVASGMTTYNIRRKKRLFHLLFRVKKGKFVFYSLRKWYNLLRKDLCTEQQSQNCKHGKMLQTDFR